MESKLTVKDMMPLKMYTPFQYSKVDTGIYRSAYPNARSFSFLSTLRLKSIIFLSSNQELREDLKRYANQMGIDIISCNIKINQEPFVVMSEVEVDQALALLTDTNRHPILICCTNGKAKTSSIIGCYRKLSGWKMSSIIHEMESFGEFDISVSDMLFVENYKVKQAK